MIALDLAGGQGRATGQAGRCHQPLAAHLSSLLNLWTPGGEERSINML
ncbi:hypothetical protein FLM9_1227 [Candidatus Synechococcus spongiarum]|uniref:Uncharacterized protein n=1 Tax=Candidatus Synechococcus spongiarum TaxID=431041 RepID=A0A171DH99_9SYNE|nr:hypothetical protein FLM9_1227 [Candidatus Synechococcus spongiarum]